jgi:hypothetical protein
MQLVQGTESAHHLRYATDHMMRENVCEPAQIFDKIKLAASALLLISTIIAAF